MCDVLGLARPFSTGHATYLLVECAGRQDPTDTLVDALAGIDGIADAAVATDAPRRAALWRYREAHGEAINTAGIPLKLDVAVPPGRLPELEAAVQNALAGVAPDARLIVFGHLGEGNLHINVLDADGLEDPITDAVLGIVAGLGGSIGAEHGVGQAKVRWLSLTRSQEELAVMTAAKRALDPNWLLNPGVVLPVPGRPPATNGRST